MKINIQNKHGSALKLLDFSVIVQPGETVAVEATEDQINRVKNTPNLEIIEDKKETKKRKGDLDE